MNDRTPITVTLMHDDDPHDVVERIGKVLAPHGVSFTLSDDDEEGCATYLIRIAPTKSAPSR